MGGRFGVERGEGEVSGVKEGMFNITDILLAKGRPIKSRMVSKMLLRIKSSLIQCCPIRHHVLQQGLA